MLVPRLLAVGIWVGVTATATTIVWAGTSTVAADLTDRPAPVVAHRDVMSALKSDAPAPETTPGISAPDAGRAAPSADPSGTDAAIPPSKAATTGVSGSEKPPANAGAPASPAVAPPTTEPNSPPTTQEAQGPTATYSTAGGAVTVVCRNSFFIDVVAATPNNGYAVNVVTAGPYYVEVHFVRAGRDAPVWAYCLGRPIQAYGSIPGQP